MLLSVNNTSSVIYAVLKMYIKCGGKRVIIFGICVIFIVGLTYYANDPCYLYPDKGENSQTIDRYCDNPCVYIYYSSYRLLNNALDLEKFDDIYQGFKLCDLAFQFGLFLGEGALLRFDFLHGVCLNGERCGRKQHGGKRQSGQTGEALMKMLHGIPTFLSAGILVNSVYSSIY